MADTDFDERNREFISRMGADAELNALSRRWFENVSRFEYSYHFTWMGLPIIQFPQDIVAMQELVWAVKPDCIIETGVARGGSLIFYASMLELLGGDGIVIGVDIDIRPHNREAIEGHPMAKRISLIQGSSIDEATVAQVRKLCGSRKRVLVTLDSNHTHEHVLSELEMYSPLVTRGSYLVVFDTVVEDLPKAQFPDRPWGPGNNPKTAVWEFLKRSDRFEIDKSIHYKLQLTVAPDGYLKCLKD